MKKPLIFALLLLGACAKARKADDIIAKYAEQMGGTAAFSNIKTLVINCDASIKGVDATLTIRIVNKRSRRIDLYLSSLNAPITTTYSNGKAWEINPSTGIATATAITGEQLTALRHESYAGSVLINYKTLGYTAVLAGEETVKGVKTYRISLKSPDIKAATDYFISVADFQLIKSSQHVEMQGHDLVVDTWYSDLKDFGPIKMYATRIQKAGDTILQISTSKTVEIDTPIADSVFDMPKS